jgi:hypothetical protein
VDISPESLKYVYASIRIASESYAGYAALLCIIVGVCFYFVSIARDGFSLTGLIAYLFTLLVLGAVSYAAFSSIKSVKQLFYAGYDFNGPFNVGYISKVSDTVWEDAALQTVTPGSPGAATPPARYDYCYVLETKSGEQDMILLRFQPPANSTCPSAPDSAELAAARDNPVRIEVNLIQRQIFWIRNDGSRIFLYQIIAVL